MLTLDSYRSKGINAYLVKVGDAIESADYGTPATPEDAQRAHRSKSHTVTIDLAKKPDGLYKYKEAIGHKSRYGWLLIQSGEIVEEYKSEAEALKAVKPEIKLPELEGTEKQIAWATQIRNKFIQQIGDRITDWSPQSAAYEAIDRHSEAKIWIDNRDKLNPEKFIQKVAELQAEWDKAEALMNLQDKIAEEENDRLVVRDDEVLDELEIYAIVYSDRIEVTSNVTGAGDRIPQGRKYVGTQGDMRWRYDLSRLDDLKQCRAIEFILDEQGNKIR